jgi:hypothetical protein
VAIEEVVGVAAGMAAWWYNEAAVTSSRPRAVAGVEGEACKT